MQLPKLHKDKLKIGAWCAAPYDGQLYRAVIKQSNFINNVQEKITWLQYNFLIGEINKLSTQIY